VLRRIVLLVIMFSGLVVLLFASGFTQEARLDSTQMKLVKERVRVTVKIREQYELLKGMVSECPPFDSTHGEPWEFVINQWQRKQLESAGAKVRVITETKPAKEISQVEYKLVKEVDLKLDGVENVIFGSKKDKSSALSEIILGTRDDDILVYNSNFDLINHMHLQDATFSKNLRYIGGIEYVKHPSVYHEDTLLSGEIEIAEEKKIYYKFELFDYTGKKLWEFKERELYEVNSTYSISNKVTVIELDHGSGVVTFIDQNGNETSKIKVCNSQGTPGEGIGGGIFSDDGEYALLIADEQCRDTLEEKERVLLFTWAGEELWRFITEENADGDDNISQHGNFILVSSLIWPSSKYPPDRMSTYLLSKKGELIRKYENALGSSICFSSNDKYALFVSYGTMFLIDLPSGEVLFKYGRWGELQQHNCFDIAEDAKLVGLATTDALVLMSFDGTKIWSHPLSSENKILSLKLSDDGKQIIIAIGSKVMIYQQVE
jgi:hypothetical protein